MSAATFLYIQNKFSLFNFLTMIVSQADRRLTYLNSKRLCEEAGIDVSTASPAYGYLRLECPIVDGQTQYQFPVLEQQTFNGVPQVGTEKRLQLQDNFVIGSKGFFLYWYNTVTKSPISDLVSYIGPHNWPRGWSNGLAGWLPSADEPLSIPGVNNAFWQDAYMKYTMNYKVLIPRYDMLQHWYIPRTQATFKTNAPVGDPAVDGYQYPWTMDERDGLSDGFMPMEPNIVLSGAKNIEINYYLPYSIPFTGLNWVATNVTNGVYQPRLVCIYRGVLLQNTTNVN